MEKDKKDKMVFLIIIGVLVLVLIGILTAIFVGRKESEKPVNQSENETGTENSNVTYDMGVPGELTEYNYICEMERPSAIEEFKVYNIEKIKVKDGNVIDTQILVKVEYKDKDLYEEYKNSMEGSENVIFDDEKMTVVQTATGIQDHTQNNDGEEIKETYEEYKNSLEEIGYKCHEAND